MRFLASEVLSHLGVVQRTQVAALFTCTNSTQEEKILECLKNRYMADSIYVMTVPSNPMHRNLPHHTCTLHRCSLIVVCFLAPPDKHRPGPDRDQSIPDDCSLIHGSTGQSSPSACFQFVSAYPPLQIAGLNCVSTFGFCHTRVSGSHP